MKIISYYFFSDSPLHHLSFKRHFDLIFSGLILYIYCQCQKRSEGCGRSARDVYSILLFNTIHCRLNVQLSRYQEKLRSSVQSMATDPKGDHLQKPGEGLDSLITTSLGYKGTGRVRKGDLFFACRWLNCEFKSCRSILPRA